MNIPKSMKAELTAWNNGKGIDLETWVACEGNFSLAVGYATIFWPTFMEVDDYILRTGDSITDLKGFECQKGATKKSTEWVINHLHIADIQHLECEDISADKLVLLGTLLKEIYEAKLATQFPDKPCIVEFYQPDDREDLAEYQISFLAKKT